MERNLSPSALDPTMRSIDFNKRELGLSNDKYATYLSSPSESKMKTLRPMSAITIGSGANLSNKTRPTSASSKNKNLPLKKSGRGLGYFGDDNDRIK